jgi:hypothetical protein
MPCASCRTPRPHLNTETSPLNTETSPPGADGFHDGDGSPNAAFDVEI